MARLIDLARKLRAGEDAATTVEYILMVLLIAMACLVAVTSFGNSLSGEFRKAVNGFR